MKIICGVLALVLMGCVSQKETVQPGGKLFPFDPRKVSELTLLKSDPSTGDHWMAVFKPSAERPRNRNLPPYWEIVSSTLDQPVLDRMADETFIFHLLDAVSSLEFQSIAPRGSLDTFGLNPPRFGVQLRVPGRHLEFQLGELVPRASGRYLTLDGKNIVIAKGAATRLFQLIDSFQFLRRKVWSVLTADEVDEISIYRTDSPPAGLGTVLDPPSQANRDNLIWYAQREGALWTDRAHRPISQAISQAISQGSPSETPSAVSLLLENLVTFKCEKVMDDPTEVGLIKAQVRQNSLYEARFSDRFGHTVSLELGWVGGHLYGIASNRPNAVFQLPSNTVESITALMKKLKISHKRVV